jgi:hypothetical protein
VIKKLVGQVRNLARLVGGHREVFDDNRQSRAVVVELVGSSLDGGGEEYRTMNVDREIVL